MSILLYRCTAWTLMKCIEEKLDGNSKNKNAMSYIEQSRGCGSDIPQNKNAMSYIEQIPEATSHESHLPPISKTIWIRWRKHAGHCWRSKDELISDVLLWTSSHRRTSVSQQIKTYQQNLCTNMGCSLEDLPRVMDDRNEWQERVRGIHTSCAS